MYYAKPETLEQAFSSSALLRLGAWEFCTAEGEGFALCLRGPSGTLASAC